ncbi:MAG: hypothetical protein L0Z50_28315 [Verrucomicrobiales bacterium]|nr:hypothetical protein [Verrucomicrobiales bacterium]
MIPLPFLVPYYQSFNTTSPVNTGLAKSGSTATTVPNGWAFVETGSGANSTYSIGNGSSSTPDTYSFGSSGSNDRAFGAIRGSGGSGLQTTIGANFQNTSGTAINKLFTGYIGEMWRVGAKGRLDQLDFQYSLDATSLTTGTWIDVNSLDFESPNNSGSVGARDGNDWHNRSIELGVISFLNIPKDASFWIRWKDKDANKDDDGLAIDDFTIAAVPEASTVLGALASLAVLAAVAFKETQRGKGWGTV